jgi:hypothetical protein
MSQCGAALRRAAKDADKDVQGLHCNGSGKSTKGSFLDHACNWVVGLMAASAVLGALWTDYALAQQPTESGPETIAVRNATAVVQWGDATVFIDPVGNQAQYAPYGRPDIVVLTRADPAHLSIDTMIGMLRRDTVVLAPQVVIDELPLMISNNVIAPFEAGMTQVVEGITFKALDATGTIPRGTQVYQRERGVIGVLMEVDGALAYF